MNEFLCPECNEPMQRVTNFWLCNNPPCGVTVFDDDLPEPLNIPEPLAELEALQAENAALKARIVELEAALDTMRVQSIHLGNRHDWNPAVLPVGWTLALQHIKDVLVNQER